MELSELPSKALQEISFRFVMNREDNELFEDFAKAIGLGSETYVKDIV
jgi:hypothetical protein